MASEETKDYILEFKIKNLNEQRESLIQTQKNLETLIKKQFKMLRRTMGGLVIYTCLVCYQTGVTMGFWGL